MHPASRWKAFKAAVMEPEITKKASVHTLGNSFATHLPENAWDIRTIPDQLGHRNLHADLMYTRVASKNTLRARGFPRCTHTGGLRPETTVQ